MQVNQARRKAKANVGRGLRAAIVPRVKAAAIKAVQIAKAKAHRQDNKVPRRKGPDNKVNPPVSNNAAGSVMAASAAVIVAHVRQLRGQRACSALQSNSSPRNLAAARSRLDVRAAVAAEALELLAIKAARAATRVHAAAVADAAASQADATKARASSWPRPSRSRLCR